MTGRWLAALCLLGILLFIAALLINDLTLYWLAASIDAGIFGYVLGHGHGERDERQRWVRRRLRQTIWHEGNDYHAEVRS